MASMTGEIGYCKKCGYDLRATEGRCPECGRTFDWGNRRTYRRKPFSRVPWKKLGLVAGTAVLLCGIAVAVIVGPDYWEWRKNQHAAEVIRKAGGRAEFNHTKVPLWWTNYLGHRWDYLGERVLYVYPPLGGNPTSPFSLTDAELGELRGLKGVEELQIENASGVTDVGLEYLSEVENLQSIALTDAQITDVGLAHLKKLKRLKNLGLVYQNQPCRITDAGFTEIGQISSLVRLYLVGVPVTGTGLCELRSLKSLRWLTLNYCGVTDEELQEVQRVKSLSNLILLKDPNLTPAGVAKLQAACPTLKIDYFP